MIAFARVSNSKSEAVAENKFAEAALCVAVFTSAMGSLQCASNSRDGAMPKLERDGVNIHYEVYGSGPPLLLTHGYSSTSAMCRHAVRASS